MRFERYIKQINKHQMLEFEEIHRQKSKSKNDYNEFNNDYQSRPVCYRRITGALLFLPHHLSQLCYLNLSEMWYLMPAAEPTPNLSENHIRLSFIRLFREYVKKGMHGHFYETFNKASNLLPLKLIRSFLCYYRIAKLKDHTFFPCDTFTCVLFHMHRFDDERDIIGELLMTVCNTRVMKKRILNTCIGEEYFRHVLKMCNKTRFDICRFLTSDNENNLVSNPHTFCPVLDCLFLGKREFLKMFLQHGFEVYEFDANTRFSIFRQYLPYYIEPELQRQPEDSLDDISPKRKFLLLDTFCLVARHSLSKRNPPIDYAECASLLFRSVPEPLITQGDLMQILSYCNLSETIATKMCRTFLKSFKEINAQQYMPRSIKHLCRCTIRKTLSRNFQLPSGINELRLPTRVSQYLLLEH